MFSSVGIKKTSIEELSAAAGLSKGSFYTFFESKEAMVLELFEQEEQSRDELLQQLQSTPEEVSIEDFFLQISRFMKENSLIKTLYKTGEFTAFSRRISDQALRDHQQQDTAFVGSVLHHFRTAGLPMDICSETSAARHLRRYYGCCSLLPCMSGRSDWDVNRGWPSCFTRWLKL